MTSPLRAILIAASLMMALALGWFALLRWYLAPRQEIAAQITAARTALDAQTETIARKPATNRDLQAYVDRTLGGKLETVDHRLRTRLNRLAEMFRLQGASVGTEGSGKPKLSPARSKFRTIAQRPLRDEVDFVEVPAWISGNGTLEDVVRLLSAIEAEPWIKRIDSVRLDPRDNGERLSINLRLTTLFLPGREPREDTLAHSPDESIDRYVSLVTGNPFRVPPPAPPVPTPQPQAPPAPPPAPPFPWNEWAVTGVAHGPQGAEAWLLHRPSGQTRVLAVGQALDAAALNSVKIESAGDSAEFTLGDQRFRVAVGTTMDQRAPAAPNGQ
jgi:hypothetical protein